MVGADPFDFLFDESEVGSAKRFLLRPMTLAAKWGIRILDDDGSAS